MKEKTTVTQSTGQVVPSLVKKIGKTTYIVHIHFSQTNEETLSDKVARLIKNEILHQT